MLVVRSIDVKPADAAQLEQLKESPAGDGAGGESASDAGLASIFGAAANNSDESKDEAKPEGETQQASRTPIVTDNVSEFSVVIEYVEVVKDSKDAKNSPKKSGKKSK